MVNRNVEAVNWEAQEYVQFDRSKNWYIALGIVSVALAGLSIWLGEWSFAVLVILAAVALVIYTVRSPRVLHYSLSDMGLVEEGKTYSLDEYKSFGVIKIGTKQYAIALTPKKKLRPRNLVYFPRESGEAIVDFLGMRLPMEEISLDVIDRIAEWLRI